MSCSVMQLHWSHDSFTINWKQWVTVICWFVTIETEIKEIYSSNNNRTDVMVEGAPANSDIVTFIDSVMPICPPPNNLHLLCDVTLTGQNVTCSERAFIVRYCLDIFEEIYSNSEWSICERESNFCVDIIYLLTVKGYVKGHISTTHLPAISSEIVKVESTSSIMNFTSTDHLHINTDTSVSTPFYPSTYPSDTTAKDTVTMETNITTTESSGKPKSGSEGGYEGLSATYIYALIGVIVVLIEVAILLFIYFYLKKRQGSSYRHPSKESLHEEIIAPETTSPTQALVVNNVTYDEEDIFKQDQKIYQSYLNLRFIDDSSVEATPEKMMLK